MPNSIGRGYLYLLVFTAGFTTLGVELSASRLLDPWFGNSQIVWASLIGLILFYLALGYWLGGRLADRSPQLLTLLRLAGLGALGVGLVPVIARPILRLASLGMADFDVGLLVGSMAGVLVLFALPVTLLGCISPFVIRLGMRDVGSSGSLAGRVYALSTGGSILGSFLPVLLLVPTIGTRRTFVTLALAMLLVTLAGLVRLRRARDSVLVLLAAALILWLGWRPTGLIKPAAGVLYETESAFNYIQVVDAGPEIQLRLNEGEGIHSVYRPGGGPAFGIWDYFLLAPAFNPAPYAPAHVQKVYVAGLAAGTVARLYTDAYGPVAIDGAELDAAILEAGRRWFAMDLPNLNAVAADGRRFLAYPSSVARADMPHENELLAYDVVIVDAYRPPYIPFHLTTVEFFSLARERLAPQGVIAVNVGRTHTDYRLVDAIAATLQQVFPSVYIVDEPDEGSELGNSLVVATRQATTLSDFKSNLAQFSHPLLAEVGGRMKDQARVATPPAGTPIFTDDRAPLEHVVHGLVLQHLFGSR